MSQITKLISSTGPGSGTVTSITSGTGITLTPNPITATGSVALTVPVVISSGGTNATSYAQSNGIVTYNGTRLVNYPGPQISSNGIYTNTAQPAFHAYVSAPLLNATGDGTVVKIPYNTVVFDNTGSFIPAINTFIAPVSGRYMLGCCIYLNNIAAANTAMVQFVRVGVRSYEIQNNPYAFTPIPVTNFIQPNSLLVDVTAGDNCYIEVVVYGSGKTVNVQSGSSSAFFWGYLVC